MRTLSAIVGIAMVSVLLILVVLTSRAEGGSPVAPYVPNIIPQPQEHAWCYVLVNSQNKLVGSIHTLSCVPKL